MEIFAIWDNRTQQFYKSNRSSFWLTKQGAISTLMFELRYVTKDNYKKHFNENEVSKEWLKDNDHYLEFNEQLRYECRRYPLKEFDYEIVKE